MTKFPRGVGALLVAALAWMVAFDSPDLAAQYVPIPPLASAVTNLNASSGDVAAATATATLGGADGKVTYICGFSITSTGATAAATVSPTVTGVTGGTMTYTYAAVAGATLINTPLTVNFSACIPASATNTAIAVSMPSLGTGNAHATVNAWGFRL